MSETTKTLEASYRKSIGSLDMRRKALESESQALYLELTTPPEENIPPMGIDTPLVDADGYPRGDVDIYRARTLRQRFQIIQTDHKELMKQTEHLLIKLAALKVRKVLPSLACIDH
jgi:26S proteasome non-ATPase regulatory subunit 9